MPDVYVVAKPGILEIPEFFSESRNFSDISFFTDICKNNSGTSFFLNGTYSKKKLLGTPLIVYKMHARARGCHAFVLLISAPQCIIYVILF